MRERTLVSISNLSDVEGGFPNTYRLAAEGFVAYHALPLSAKGEVNGVIEVYHRAPFTHDANWLSLYETIAGQAGIAIDNARLFEGLQQSNMELFMAYDATIEGWSRALDLRDKETEGHTQRGSTGRRWRISGAGRCCTILVRWVCLTKFCSSQTRLPRRNG